MAWCFVVFGMCTPHASLAILHRWPRLGALRCRSLLAPQTSAVSMPHSRRRSMKGPTLSIFVRVSAKARAAPFLGKSHEVRTVLCWHDMDAFNLAAFAQLHWNSCVGVRCMVHEATSRLTSNGRHIVAAFLFKTRQMQVGRNI